MGDSRDAASGDSDARTLDEAFEAFVEARYEGTVLDWRSFADGREHLEPELERLWDLACTMTEDRVRTRRIGRYGLIRELGRGAMGVVYLAAQESLGGRRVALKVMSAPMVVGERGRARFLAEAHALARVKHANIVEIFEVLEDAGRIAFAMEWVEGGTLGDVVDARRASARRESPGGRAGCTPELAAMSRRDFVPFICRTGVSIGRALQAVHRSGMMHRDVKPTNILMRPDGSPVLSDFGLVRDEQSALRTQSGMFLGTLAFAPPEQLRGDELDARADVYSLASTLYYCLTSTLPHAGSSQVQLLRSMEQGQARPLRRLAPDLPRDLETVLSKAMEYAPEDRYDGAEALADDLDRILALQPIRGKRQSALKRTWKWARRQRRGIAAAALGALATAVLVGWRMDVQRRDEQRARRIERLVHDARLALLDTDLESRVRIGLRFGDPALVEVVIAQSGVALALYDEAAALDRDRRDIELERDAVAGALDVLRGDPSGWEPRPAEGREAVELRAKGLFAYVTGDVGAAVKAWQGLEAFGPPDPLLSALLGQAQLYLGRPELAYPRLARAAEGFPDAGFLQVSAARAALLCGDVDVAARLAERARDAGVRAEDEQLLALEADLAWTRGDPATGIEIYTRESLAESYLREAEDAVRRGALETVVFAFGSLISNSPDDTDLRRQFLRHAHRWWASLGGPERREVLLRGLRGERRELGYVFGVLAQVATSIEHIRELAGSAPDAPPFSLRGSDAIFDRDIRDGRWSGDSIEALAQRVDARSIDLERVIDLEPIHPRLVDDWLSPDALSGSGRAATARDVLAANGALLAPPQTAFGPVRAAIPPPFHLVAEVDAEVLGQQTGLGVSFGAMWNAFHAATGDLDGDGSSDFLIGCTTRDDEPARAGRVCALSGADGHLIWQLVGSAYDDLGVNVCTVRDVDQDGIVDVLVSRARVTADQDAPISLVSGATGRILRSFEADQIEGVRPPRFAGVSGPGTSELSFVVGLEGASTDGNREGCVRAFTADGRVLWTTYGDAPDSGLGRSIVSAGDIDGDGFDDVVAGCSPAGGSVRVTTLSGATGALIHSFETRGLRDWATLPLAARTQHGHAPQVPLVSVADGAPRLIALDLATGEVCPREAWANGAGGMADEGFGIFTQSLGDLDGDGLSEVSISSLSGRSPRRPRVRIYSSRGGCIAELEGFIWVRRLGFDPLLPPPTSKRLVAIGLDSWSRYADRPVGGPARIVWIDYRG